MWLSRSEENQSIASFKTEADKKFLLAIAFGYFEALVRLGDPAKTRAEAGRLKTLNNLLDATGQEAFMYEDWVDLTLNLLEQTASISSAQDNEAALLEAFNDLETANAITQHFRVRPSIVFSITEHNIDFFFFQR